LRRIDRYRRTTACLNHGPGGVHQGAGGGKRKDRRCNRQIFLQTPLPVEAERRMIDSGTDIHLLIPLVTAKAGTTRYFGNHGRNWRDTAKKSAAGPPAKQAVRFGLPMWRRIDSRALPGNILELGGAAEVEVVLSPANAGVTGVVRTGGADAPAAGAQVVLIAQDEGRLVEADVYLVTTADDSGKFSFSGVVPGEYKAFAWEKLTGCCDYMEPAFLRSVESRGVTVTLDEKTSANIELSAIASDK
jgi:hypothetical protein